MNTNQFLTKALESYHIYLATESHDISHETPKVEELLEFLHNNNDISEQWLKINIHIINKSLKCYKNDLLENIKIARDTGDFQKLEKYQKTLEEFNNYLLNK